MMRLRTLREPVFPNFKPLELTDRLAIEVFTAQFEPYSDFCFSTLIFYNAGQHSYWCWLNGNLVFRFRDSFGPGTFLTFLGSEKAAATAHALIDHGLEMGYSPTLWRIPEVAARAITCESADFHVEEDRDGFDYVYRADQLARLEGPAVSKVRYDVRLLERQHPECQVVMLDLCDPSTQAFLQAVRLEWQNDGQTDTIRDYRQALDACFRSVPLFEVLGIGLEIDGSLAGFAIGERPRKDWLFYHFSMANPHRAGLSGRLLHELAKRGLASGCQNLNWQEDVGNPGLRQFKRKCAPSGFLRKFSVQRRKNETQTCF